LASIHFVGTYPPIRCGIADYTSFITEKSPAWKWAVLSFRLDSGELPVTISDFAATKNIWYGIPGPRKFSASVIENGLRELGVRNDDAVLWFQHEFGIWFNDQAFVDMLRGLDLPKVVTFHTLRFQSTETPTGLVRYEYNLLQALLSYVDAITVFSQGVYNAVTSAFPEHRQKVHIIRHGVHSYPAVSSLSRREAKEALNAFLLYESELDRETKEALHKQRIFLDPDTIILGQTGFLHPVKGSEHLYPARDELQKLIPDRRIVAVRIGIPRREEDIGHASELRVKQNGIDKFLLKTWLPQRLLPLAQRAFDVNYYWPYECTQSGVLTHALGAGAIIAGRDLEGVGETLKDAGEMADSDPERLLLKIQDHVLNPFLQHRVEQKALAYARRFSWENQTRLHYQLAQEVLSSAPTLVASNALVEAGAIGAPLTAWRILS
jgi:glycosyltransferase involved in cell wall biosynthesis